MIKEINLQNFRNHSEKNIYFKKKINVFLGENGSGKTSILEAFFFAMENSSFRTKKFQDLIKNEQQLAKINLKLLDFNKLWKELDVELSPIKKKVLLNGTENIGINKTIVSIPIFINNKLINNFKYQKTTRQSLINMLIKQDHKIYEKLLLDFDKLLISLQDINNNSIVINRSLKSEIVNSLKDLEEEIINIREKEVENINFFYQKNTKNYLNKELKLYYKKAIILKDYILENLLLKPPITITKDDYIIEYDKEFYLNISSDGHMKMAILLLVISFIEYLREQYDLEFILLLDDIFSELDKKNSNLLLKILLDKNLNSFITSPKAKVDQNLKQKIQFIEI
ncbi:MAG: DNA replication and repair protein RecF [Candidatus Hepatoplasma scabrum]|nr:MAG: DNA replication and repair protein RecF [Candidatus Hepatoplasma sp.]